MLPEQVPDAQRGAGHACQERGEGRRPGRPQGPLARPGTMIIKFIILSLCKEKLLKDFTRYSYKQQYEQPLKRD